MSSRFEVPAEEMEVYLRARGVLEREAIPYMVGGGYAVACYAHRRPTKDIDFILLAADAERAIVALEQEKFFVRRSDPRWIFQATCAGVMVDLIFGSMTHRGVVPVTREWLDNAGEQAISGEGFPVIAPEELIAQKILAQHENRPDWWDAEVILAGRKEQVDWERILRIAAIDPLKTLAFLLFIETRHPGQGRYPREILDRAWHEAGSELGLGSPCAS